MAYSKQTWENEPKHTSPISAEQLNHIEDGIYNNSLHIEENTDDIATANTNIQTINNKIPSNASSVNKLATYNDIPSLTNYVQKSSTAGLLKNDGTVDTTSYATNSALNNKVSKSSTTGLLKNDGTVDTTSYATTSALNNKADNTPTFTEASTRTNIVSGETIPTILGKIKKYFADLKTIAFTGSYNDLTDKPSIPTGQVNSDWNATSGVAQILNKPTIPAAQIQSDWNQTNTSAKDYIKNKPNIPSGVVVDTELSTTSTNPVQNKVITSALNGKANSSSLATVATTGSYNDLSNKPTIPAAQVNSDWNATSGKAQILNKPTIPAAQIQSDWNQTNTSAKDYIKNKPTIPSGVTVDSALSTTSTNPVQNKVVTGAINGKANNTTSFTEASTRANIASGETIPTILGKIKKYFTDLKTVAFSGSYNDLSNKPTIPTVDSALSTTSTNPVQNKLTTRELKLKAGYGNMSTSDFLLQMSSSGGVDTLELVSLNKDSEPTENSTWAVESGGVYTALSGKASNTPTFSEASTRTNIASGETIPTILGKIKKYFTDLAPHFELVDNEWRKVRTFVMKDPYREDITYDEYEICFDSVYPPDINGRVYLTDWATIPSAHIAKGVRISHVDCFLQYYNSNEIWSVSVNYFPGVKIYYDTGYYIALRNEGTIDLRNYGSDSHYNNLYGTARYIVPR